MILVVEDDIDIRESIVEIATDAGHPALGAADGEVALRYLREGVKPKAILLDYYMPRCDGESFLRQYFEDEQYPAVPIYLMSGRPGINDPHVTGHLPKPFDIETLLAILDQV